MTTLQPAAPRSDASVSRDLVHRWALGEVFLTGAEHTGEDSFACTAQLPRSHAYFSDAATKARHFDTMLVVETVRQAALMVAHEGYQVPRAHKFVLTGFHVAISDVAATRIGSVPGELRMDVAVVDKKLRKGQVTGLRYAMDLSLAGLRVGTAEIGLVFSSGTGYTMLRDRDRVVGGLPAIADSGRFAPRYPAPAPVSPGEVGRLRPENVVVGPLRTETGGPLAQVVVDPEHPSLFDHPQDHVPGMVLGEAARQVAVLASARQHALDPASAFLRRCELEFTRFAELEHPVTAQVVSHSAPSRTAGAIVVAMVVRLTQGESALAVGQIELAYPLGG
jgi:2-oxo-3-(phosphooxy)propyl 3-oxoalkanoate synthase